MTVQVPKEPARLQLAQAPEQEVLQQVPPTQNAEAHSFAEAQSCPLAFFTVQVPLGLQKEPGGHCESRVQPPGQMGALPLQVAGAQLGLPGLPAGLNWQVPGADARLQLSQAPEQALLQQVPSTQKPLRHWLPWPQACPRLFLGTQAPLAQNDPAAQVASLPQLEGQAALAPSQR